MLLKFEAHIKILEKKVNSGFHNNYIRTFTKLSVNSIIEEGWVIYMLIIWITTNNE